MQTLNSNIYKRLQKQYQLIQPVTSFECPFNCLMIEGGSETVHTVKVPSDAPYASRSELMCPNFKTVTAYIKPIKLHHREKSKSTTQINDSNVKGLRGKNTRCLALIKDAIHSYKRISRFRPSTT